MTETYTDHSVPAPALGSAFRTEASAPSSFSVATPLTVPLRRALLARSAAGLALLAGVAATASAAPGSPDAVLIALCARLDALQRQIDALFPADWHGMMDAALEAADAAARRFEVEQRPILDQICALTPVTVAGFAALARSMSLLRPDLGHVSRHEDPDVRLAGVLVRGLAGKA